MQLLYDESSDQLIVKCSNIHETDQLAKLLPDNSFESGERGAVVIDSFTQSALHQCAKVEDPGLAGVKPYFCVSALSGSGRFNPGRNHLFDKLGINFIDYNLQKHSMFCSPYVLAGAETCPVEELREKYIDLCNYISLDCLRVVDEYSWSLGDAVCVDMHLPILLRYLKYQEDFRVIYQFRDPRDWMVSTYFFFCNVFLNHRDRSPRNRCYDLYCEHDDDRFRVFTALIDAGLVFCPPAEHREPMSGLAIPFSMWQCAGHGDAAGPGFVR